MKNIVNITSTPFQITLPPGFTYHSQSNSISNSKELNLLLVCIQSDGRHDNMSEDFLATLSKDNKLTKINSTVKNSGLILEKGSPLTLEQKNDPNQPPFDECSFTCMFNHKDTILVISCIIRDPLQVEVAKEKLVELLETIKLTPCSLYNSPACLNDNYFSHKKIYPLFKNHEN